MGFKKGQSGNLKGRPPGTGCVQQLRALLEPRAPELVDKAIALAMSGDTTALKLCLERICPPVKVRDDPVKLELPEEGGITEIGRAVIAAMADGTLTPAECGSILGALGVQAKLAEIDEVEKRLRALEDAHTSANAPSET